MNWDGKNVGLEMKKIMQEIETDGMDLGGIFRILVSKKFNKIMEMPFSKKYGSVSFDGYLGNSLGF